MWCNAQKTHPHRKGERNFIFRGSERKKKRACNQWVRKGAERGKCVFFHVTHFNQANDEFKLLHIGLKIGAWITCIIDAPRWSVSSQVVNVCQLAHKKRTHTTEKWIHMYICIYNKLHIILNVGLGKFNLFWFKRYCNWIFIRFICGDGVAHQFPEINRNWFEHL